METQELCRHEVSWDDPIRDDIKVKWEKWRADLLQVQRISIPRCYKPENFGGVVNAQLHHFSDASVKGYGQCSLLATHRWTPENSLFLCYGQLQSGPICQLRSDRGTNFVGARNELTQALAEMDQEKIKTKLLEEQCDWFSFKLNVPAASHMGGVWERQIRSVRNVLSSLLQDNGKQLDDESLSTLMSEAEAIVNSCLLTVNQLADPDSSSPLTPNHLLTMKSKVILAPPGAFQPADVYCRKRWRRVQHLANEFWTRWKKEFLLSLQQRQKWTRPRRNYLLMTSSWSKMKISLELHGSLQEYQPSTLTPTVKCARFK